MSINLGNDAIEGVRRLREFPEWQFVLDGVLEVTRRAMNLSLETAGERAGDQIGYARALRDLWVALEAATNNTTPNRVEKPTPVGRTKSLV